jgi:catechol 2,3-dioxygenase-like lactoylglutathione lyase family enzyme
MSGQDGQVGRGESATQAMGAAVHSLDHFAFEVPDLEQAERFYIDFGLNVRKAEARLDLYTFDHPHCWATITQGDAKRLRYLSFGAYAQDMAEFAARLQRAGIERCASVSGEGGLWLRSPDGLPIQIKAAEKSSPEAKTKFGALSSPPGKAGAVRKALAPIVYPRRLCHIAVFTANIADAIEFYKRVMGLRLSDRSRDIIAFMHGVHGSDHHLIALIRSDHAGLHHSSWDMPTFHDIGLASQRMVDKGYSVGWGLGRHLLGSNYFYYVRDPWMSFAEYSADMDYIPAGSDWQPGDHDPDDAFSFWGPRPPEQFAHNFEAGQK